MGVFINFPNAKHETLFKLHLHILISFKYVIKMYSVYPGIFKTWASEAHMLLSIDNAGLHLKLLKRGMLILNLNIYM